MLLVFHCCCYFGDIHWERVQVGRWGEKQEVTSHPEQVLVTVVLVLLPVGCRVVTPVKAGRAGLAAHPLPVRLVQEADQIFVALLLKQRLLWGSQGRRGPRGFSPAQMERLLNRSEHGLLSMTQLTTISLLVPTLETRFVFITLVSYFQRCRFDQVQVLVWQVSKDV